jgi:hypothetical protein
MPGQGDRIQVDGLKENLKNLRALGDKGTLDAVKQANVDAAQILVRSALPLVPRRSGKLAATLKPTRTTAYAGVRAGSASVPYAGPIHFGWFYDRNWFIKKNIKPNPFLFRAFGYSKQEIMATYQRNMEIAIKKHDL